MAKSKPKILYFEPAIQISNRELYNVFTNWVKTKELAKARIFPVITQKYKDGSHGSYYAIIYGKKSATFDFFENESMPPISITDNRTRNIHRVASKLSKLLRLDDLGGLVQVQPEQTK